MNKENINKKTQVHPRKRANLLSHLFFCWELPIFLKGYKKQLTVSDLYGPLKEHESSILGDKIEQAWNQELRNTQNPSLWRIFRKVFGFEFLLYGFLLIPIELVCRLSQPLLLGQLLKYYTPDQTTMSIDEAYLYASLIVVMSFFYVLLGHFYALGVQHIGMKIRVACSALIYRKSLTLNQQALVQTTVGQLVNILSNDVSKFNFLVSQAHFLWMGPLEILIILYLVYSELGATAVVGIALLLTFIPVQMFLSKKISVFRMRTALKTDQRIRFMNEIITGIKVIKMYTWEKSFAKLVEKSRKLEIDQIKSSSYLRAINMACTIILSRTAVFLCILTYTLNGHSLDPHYVYVLSSFYEIIRLGSVIFLPLAMLFLGEAITSVKRIQKFLILPNIEENHQEVATQKLISMNQISAKWDDTSSDETLTNVTLKVEPNQLVAIIGPVGSGKTTLLQVALKEILPSQGTLRVEGSVSYSSQEAWIFSGTIQDNILFGEKFDQQRYNDVIRVCALEADFALFPFGDRSLVGERGVMLSGGQKARINLARAIYQDADFYLLDDPLSAVDAHVGNQLFDSCIRNFLCKKARLLVTHQLQYLRGVDYIYLIENGKITASGSYQELKSSNNEFLKLLESEKEEETIKSGGQNKNINTDENENAPVEVKEEQGGGSISTDVYRRYFKSGGNFIAVSVILVSHILVQLAGNGSDYFISFWVNLEQQNFNNTIFTSDDCFYIYSGLIAFLIFISLICLVNFFKFCLNASTNLHNKMFYKIVHMPMRFFYNNPSGRILNRFSQDIGTVDEVLPLNLSDTIEVSLNVLAIVVIIAVINPWILIPTVIIFGMFYYCRIIYLATSRNLKRIEGITRSPVFSHISSSLEGLASIRASHAQNNLITQFNNHQDLNSSSYYMFIACDSAFGFWLDFFCVVYLGLVTFSLLFIGSETHGANVGLSITQAITMTGLLQYGMKQWCALENQMTSVERIVNYSELEPENDTGDKNISSSWPSDGRLEFKLVSLRYSSESPTILKDLSFEIAPTEKIGIVGRTGAGKSSLVTVLFRLAEIEGEVLIDSMNTKIMSLQNVRSKISIIPQEPVLFSGTIRNNLDPFDKYQDYHLWEALDQVELKTVISDLPSGLASKVSEGGANFSVGQRQLLCLARALLCMNKILILDEATANVDPQTDELIQKTIRKKFMDCTVLTIAHRLHTVLDCDRVMVMDAGRVVEFDSPGKLLKESGGAFYSLVEQNGQDISQLLYKMNNKNGNNN